MTDYNIRLYYLISDYIRLCQINQYIFAWYNMKVVFYWKPCTSRLNDRKQLFRPEPLPWQLPAPKISCAWLDWFIPFWTTENRFQCFMMFHDASSFNVFHQNKMNKVHQMDQSGTKCSFSWARHGFTSKNMWNIVKPSLQSFGGLVCWHSWHSEIEKNLPGPGMLSTWLPRLQAWEHRRPTTGYNQLIVNRCE